MGAATPSTSRYVNLRQDREMSEVASPPKSRAEMSFQYTKLAAVHGWYPYVEGFSAEYVLDALALADKGTSVYDPFGGAGTTQLTASILGLPSFYAEVNPFMVFVSETKVVSASWARSNLGRWDELATAFIALLHAGALKKHSHDVCLDAYLRAFPERDFFEEQHIRELLAAKALAYEVAEDDDHIRRLFLLAISGIAVASSNMTRRADLRRRRVGEYKNRVVDVSSYLSLALEKMTTDLHTLPLEMAATHHISSDARQLATDYTDSFDLAITSPPYLNGTNYFRNTKIELWLTDFISTETELRNFRDQTITAGINDVGKGRTLQKTFERVEEVASQLDTSGGDRRIAVMVRHYFADMFAACSEVARTLKKNGTFLLDIGDSKFYGIHVPTDLLLVEVAAEAGLELANRRVLANRYSRDKTPLVQAELLFLKP